jgi:cytochrome c oxidase cbb3-type subunit 3
MKRRLIFFFALLLFISCEREERGFRVQTPDANRINSKQLSTLHVGETSPTPAFENQYENNAFAMSEGKRLFSQMNCTGCHANGGGAIGPALMDDKWIYGGQPDQIFATIVEGRPNGMPSFHGKMPDYEVWQIAAYVRSLSGNASKNAAPGRNDDMQIGQPENSKKKETIQNVSPPKSQ